MSCHKDKNDKDAMIMMLIMVLEIIFFDKKLGVL